MIQITLSGWISIEIWRVFLTFARIATAFMMLPGFGEPGIPSRVRILAALAFSAAVSSTIGPVPPPPMNAYALAFGLIPDVFTGALLGCLSRILMSGISTAGMVIGQNIGLTNIFAQGIGFEQSAALGTAINAGFIAAFFAMDGEHLVLHSLMGSYDVVAAGYFPNITDSAHAILSATAKSFDLATQLAAPFLILTLLFNVSLALVNKIMPSLPVFHIAQPALVGIGLYLLAAAAGTVLDHALTSYTDIMMTVQ